MASDDREKAFDDGSGLGAQQSDATHSRVFRMGAGRFARELLFRYSGIWLLVLSLMAVAGIALGITVDLRWLMVGLMVVFVAVPMVLAFLYYYHGLRRGCFVNTIAHRIVIEDDGLTARLIIPVYPAGEEKESGQESGQEAETVSYRTRDEFFPYADMETFRIGSDSAIIPLRAPSTGFLWIPADAFNDTRHLSDLLRKLDSVTERQKTK